MSNALFRRSNIISPVFLVSGLEFGNEEEEVGAERRATRPLPERQQRRNRTSRLDTPPDSDNLVPRTCFVAQD